MGVIGDFLKNYKDMRITYLRDMFGFKCGVIVTLGRGKNTKIGWSVSNPEDSKFIRTKPHNVPAYDFLVRHNVSTDMIVRSNFFQYIIERPFIPVPNFDKVMGVSVALNRALVSPIQMDGEDCYNFPKGFPIHNTVAMKAVQEIADYNFF